MTAQFHPAHGPGVRPAHGPGTRARRPSAIPAPPDRSAVAIDRPMMCAAGVAALLVIPLMHTIEGPLPAALAAQALAYVVLAASGVLLSIIDIRAHRLPNPLVGATAGAGLALFGLASLFRGDAADLLRAMTAALAVGLVFTCLGMIRGGALGGGDVKFAAALALYTGWLGWEAVVLGVAAGFVFGGMGAAWVLIARRADASTRIAFGPFLFAGAWIAIALALPVA